jgi:hypothetical protein
MMEWMLRKQHYQKKKNYKKICLVHIYSDYLYSISLMALLSVA